MHSLAIASAACVAAALLVLVRLHLLPTGRDAVTEAVSDYGVGAYHRHYRAMVVLLGAGAGLLLGALIEQDEAGPAGLAFLAAFALARVAIAFFMTDAGRETGGPVTTEGRIHVLLAAIAFTSIAFAAADLASSLDGSPAWTGTIADVLRILSKAVVISAVGTALAYVLEPIRQRAFGAVERLLYAATFAFLLAAAIHLAAA